jgi:hypothetical protein
MPKTSKTTKRSLLYKLTAGNGPISMRLLKQVECKNWRVRQLVDCDLRQDQHGDFLDHYLVDWDLSDHGFECDLSWEPEYNISQDLKNEFHRLRGQNYMIMNGPPVDKPSRIMPVRRCKTVALPITSVKPINLPSLSPVVPIGPIELDSLHQSDGNVPPPVSVASSTMVSSATSFRSTAIFPTAPVDICGTVDPWNRSLKKQPAKRRLVFPYLQDNLKMPILMLPLPVKVSLLASPVKVPTNFKNFASVTSKKNSTTLEELKIREKQCNSYQSDKQSPDGYQSESTDDDEYVPQRNV